MGNQGVANVTPFSCFDGAKLCNVQNFCYGIATCKLMLYNVIIVEIYSQFDVLRRIIYINVIKKLLKCIF